MEKINAKGTFRWIDSSPKSRNDSKDTLIAKTVAASHLSRMQICNRICKNKKKATVGETLLDTSGALPKHAL